MSVNNKYPCKQIELYSVSMMALHSFEENQAAFESFKPKYADPYRDNLSGLLTAALDLPGFQQRDMRTEVLGIQMREAAKRCLDNWQALRRYIRDVAGWENIQKPKLEAAGSREYARAASYNWEYVALLSHEGRTFMEQFDAELQGDGNMPAGFVTEFEADMSAYMNLFNQLMDAAQDNPQEARAKVLANNALYEELMRMMEDGQFIFRDDSTLKQRFTFTRVLNRIRRPSGGGSPTPDPVPGDGVGSIGGTVVRSDTGSGLGGAEVTIAALGLVAVTDALGHFALVDVPAGTHPVMAWHAEMEAQTQEVTVGAGAEVGVTFSLGPLGE
jgi:hypothetical protein